MKPLRFLAWLAAFLIMLLTLGLATGAWFLHHGFTLSHVDYKTVQVRKLFVQWQDGLVITAQEVVVQEDGSDTDPVAVPKLLRLLRLADRLLQRVEIDRVEVNGVATAIVYEPGEGKRSAFSFDTDDLRCHGFVEQKADGLYFSLDDVTSRTWQSVVRGEIIVRPQKEEVTGSLHASIADSLDLAVDFNLDRQGVRFHGSQQGSVATIAPLLDLFAVPAEVRPWLDERLQAHAFHLQMFSGDYQWHKGGDFLQSVRAVVMVDQAHYFFAGQDLPELVCPRLRVELQQGKLTITPDGAAWAGHDVTEIAAAIDFRRPAALGLTLDLSLLTPFDPQIKKLLAFYDVDLPLLQTRGETAAKLRLTIPFGPGRTGIKGQVTVADGLFQVGQEEYHLPEASLAILNQKITINKLHLVQEGRLDAVVNGEVMARARPLFSLTVQLNQMQRQWHGSLLALQKPVIIRLQQDESMATIQVGQCQLNVAERLLTVFPFTAEYRDRQRQIFFRHLVARDRETGLRAQLRGEVGLAPLIARLEVKLDDGPLAGLHLQGRPVTLAVDYDGQLSATLSALTFAINGRQILLSSARLQQEQGGYDLQVKGSKVADLFSGDMELFFEPTQGRGWLDTSALTMAPAFAGFFALPEKIDFELEHDGGKRVVRLVRPELTVAFEQGQGWQLSVADLGRSSEVFTFLRPLALRDGALSCVSGHDNSRVECQGEVDTQLQILWQEKQPLQKWPLSGWFEDGQMRLQVADSIDLAITGKEITVQTRKIGFSLPDLRKMSLPEKMPATAGGGAQQSTFSFIATDCFVRLTDKNVLLADTLRLGWDGKRLAATLDQGQGHMRFVALDGEFSLQGDGFGDQFLSSLLNGSRFKGGTFGVVAGGSMDKYDVAFSVKDSHVNDFTIINYIVAFVDTVPSLLSFSLPGYTTRGMDIIRADGVLTISGDQARLNSFSLQSSTISMAATGTIDFGKRDLDLLVNVMSPIEKSLASIPLAGLLFQGNSELLAVTLTVKGAIDNPEISTTMFQGIPAKGFNVLKRALNLPLDIVDEVVPSFSSEKSLDKAEGP